jgi:hypothetical protein
MPRAISGVIAATPSGLAHFIMDAKKAADGSRLFRSDAPGASVLGFDTSAVRYFPLVDSQAEAAIRIGAGPRFEDHRSAFLPIV